MARRQSLAAFCAPALDNEATAFGAHALTKAVSFGAPTIVGLKSSLHSNPPRIKYQYWKMGRLTTVLCSVKEVFWDFNGLPGLLRSSFNNESRDGFQC